MQQPRIPVWVASRWPNRRPLRRAARFRRAFPIDLPGPDALAELAAEVPSCAARGPTTWSSPTRPGPTAPWAAAGATWCLTGFGLAADPAEVRAAIDA